MTIARPMALIEVYVAPSDFTSLEDAIPALLGDAMAIDEDELVWAKPLVNQARMASERGAFLFFEEHRARNQSRLAAMRTYRATLVVNAVAVGCHTSGRSPCALAQQPTSGAERRRSGAPRSRALTPAGHDVVARGPRAGLASSFGDAAATGRRRQPTRAGPEATSYTFDLPDGFAAPGD